MTPDKTPSDAELLELNAGEVHFSESPTKYPEAGHGTQYHAGAPGVLSFARAILAKWGSPVVATKVTIPTSTMEQEFQNHYRRGFDAGKKAGSPVAAVEPCVICGSGEPYTGTCGSNDPRALCKSITTPQPTQAQAGAVPKYRMLEPGVDRIDAADEYLQDDAQTWEKDPGGVFVGSIYGGALRPARRVITSLIGITHKEGGQHAAD